MTQKVTPISISIPVDMIKKIDELRGDVTRSRYIFRMIEKHYSSDMETKKKK